MRAVGALLICLLFWATSFAAEPTFIPERHMSLSEVKPGMRGYGLSVFSGTRIDRFEVEVVSILRNFNPKQDVILIRASGANLEQTGAIAGMSGSPVYLDDGAGRYRLIGAFAYGWPMMKEPLAGVQPIEYMLKMPLAAAKPAGPVAQAGHGGSWSVLSAMQQSKAKLLTAPAEAKATSLTRMALPLSVSGMSEQSLAALANVLKPRGLMPLQAGGGATDEDLELAPGSVMAVPLLSGDIEATALGTCTDVIDGTAYGFGHPFTGAGPVEMPMCGGRVNGVISNLVTSFKLGSAAKPIGTVLADQTSGVAGRLGGSPATAPMRLRVRYADGSIEQEYRFRAIIHPEFTPLLVGSAAVGSLSAHRELPHFNTIDFALTVRFNNGQEVKIADRMANMPPMMMLASIASALSTAAENPFQQAMVASVDGEVTISEGANTAEIRHIAAGRQVYEPGETLHLFATLRPFRGATSTQPITLQLPTDLPDGKYKLVLSDASQFISAEQESRPHRFAASSVSEVFAVLNEIGALRSDVLYLRLDRTNKGVAVGRTSLNELPSTHRQMLLATGRSDVAPYTPAVTAQIPSSFVISGSAEVEIQVSRQPLGRRAAAEAN